MSLPSVSVDQGDAGSLCLRFRGAWRLQNGLASRSEVAAALSTGSISRVSCDTNELTAWDSGLLTFALETRRLARKKGAEFDSRGLPEGVRRLMAMSDAVPEAQPRGAAINVSALARVGIGTIELLHEVKYMLAFVGETVVAFGRFMLGRARYRLSDLLAITYVSGAQALGIVALITFLVGSILAFIGALELRKFGAEIYIANLVGNGMAREMAPMMTAIIMAGRTGAAFAAQLGTMTVNEEIDALRTLGVRPTEFLVLPRVLALSTMMPLLTLYGIVVGSLGGAIVANAFLGISYVQYFEQMFGGLRIADVAVGLTKGVVFGILVAMAGCLRGMQSGRSAAAVGAAATSAVVTSIVLIIATDALFGLVLNLLGT